jgi:hypothetical protein
LGGSNPLRCQSATAFDRPLLCTLFGFTADSLMPLCYALKNRSPWYVLGFAAACALSGIYAVLQGAWPFGMVEGVFTIVALRHFQQRLKAA